MHDSGVKYILSHNGNVWIYAEDIPNEKVVYLFGNLNSIRNLPIEKQWLWFRKNNFSFIFIRLEILLYY